MALLVHWPLNKFRELAQASPPWSDSILASCVDISGNANHGRLMPTFASDAPVLTTGPFPLYNNGLLFDGSNDYCESTAGAAATGNVFTLMAWIYPLDLGRRTIVSGGNASGQYTFSVSSQIGAGALEITYPGVFVDISSVGVITAKRWTHVAYSRPGTDSGFFCVNGARVGIGQHASVLMGSGSNGYIGCRAPGLQHFNGRLASIRQYSNALTESEIYNIYQESILANSALGLTNDAF